MNNKLIREIKIICASLVMGAVFAMLFQAAAYAERTSHELSNKFIRFHVLANSDTEADQALKLKVRDAVLESIGERASSCETLPETREMLKGSLAEIEAVAERVISENGYAYGVRASVERAYFPTKAYGNVTLAAGSYEALRVEIGESDGANWWCVVYPPLCYVDAAKSEVSDDYAKRLKADLTDEEYSLVSQDGDVSVKIKFKTIEVFQESKVLLASIGDSISETFNNR